MAADGFAGARSKVERAKHHINDLNRQIEAFFAQGSHRLVVETNAQVRQRALRIKADAPIPDLFSTVVGDAAHNLRSALDHAVWAAVSPHLAAGEKSGSVQFPFATKAESLEGTIAQRKVKLAGEKVVEAIRAMKPYPGGNDLLAGLDALDIADKHKTLALMASALGINNLDFREIDPTGTPVSFVGVTMNPNEAGYLFAWPYTPMTRYERKKRGLGPIKQNAKLDCAFTILFAQGQPFPRNGVIPTLKRVVVEVERCLDAIQGATA